MSSKWYLLLEYSSTSKFPFVTDSICIPVSAHHTFATDDCSDLSGKKFIRHASFVKNTVIWPSIIQPTSTTQQNGYSDKI